MKDRFNISDLGEFNYPNPISVGTLLVASPSLMNTPFERAVVLVLQSGDDGTFGVALNRPANDQLRSAWYQMTGASNGEQSIVHGGPIGGPVFAIHQEPSLAEMEMPGGVFISSDSGAVQELVNHPGLDYRIVFGVAGWKPGQLAHEVDAGLWFKLDGDAQNVFDDPDWLWEKSLRRYGNQVLCETVGLSGILGDPSLN